MLSTSARRIASVSARHPGRFAMSNLVERPTFKAKYDNYINGKFVPPIDGAYFDNVSPIDGKPFTKAARSNYKVSFCGGFRCGIFYKIRGIMMFQLSKPVFT